MVQVQCCCRKAAFVHLLNVYEREITLDSGQESKELYLDHKHPNALLAAVTVVNELKPIYSRLSKTKQTRVNPLIRWLDKDAPKIVSGQAYLDFALADLVPHFNDEKRGHAGIFSQMRLDAGIYLSRSLIIVAGRNYLAVC